MVAPGLLERMISPAILLARTSRMLGDTAMCKRYPSSPPNLPLKREKYKTIPLFVNLMFSEKEWMKWVFTEFILCSVKCL
jgi:hypothetical protein